MRDKKKITKNFKFIERVIAILINSALAIYWIPIFIDSTNHPAVIRTMRSILNAQSKFYQHNKRFSISPSLYKKELGIDISSIYQLKSSPNTLFVVYIPTEGAAYRDHGLFKMWRSPHIRSYVGAIFTQDKSKSVQIICALNEPARDIPNQPTFKAGIATCGEGTFMIPETVNSLDEITYI